MECALIFIDPVPSADDYNKMYAKTYHQQFYFKEIAPDYSSIYNIAGQFVKQRVIVDYGCGDGSFIKFFAAKGYRCFGVEYDPQLVQTLKKDSPEVNFYTVDEFWNLPGEIKFGVIYLGDVLEHMEKPVTFIEDLKQKLADDGLLLIQGPLENNNNIALRFRKAMSQLKTKVKAETTATHIPYHIFFSDAANQEDLFLKRGFKTLYFKVYETTWPFS